MNNRKGLWLPDEILSNKRLSMADQFIVSHIGYQAALNGGLCYDTNATIADACYLHPMTVSDRLGRLSNDNGPLAQWFVGVRCLEPAPDILALFTDYILNAEVLERFKTIHPATHAAIFSECVQNHLTRSREQKKYQKARSANCQACASSDRLVAHHLIPVRAGGVMANGIITLCDTCHRAVHTIDGHLNWKHVNAELTRHFSNIINS